MIGPGRPEHLAPVAEAMEHPVTDQERDTIEAAVAGLAPREARTEAPEPRTEAPEQATKDALMEAEP